MAFGHSSAGNAHRLRLAYVTAYDSTDITKWSGLGYHIARCLEDQGIELVRIGGLRRQLNPVNIAKYLWNTRVRGVRDHPHRDPGYLRHYGAQVERQLARAHTPSRPIDAIVVPGILPIAYCDTCLPIIVWTDCTFASLLDYYPAWTNLSARTIRDGHEADRRGLRRAQRLIFASDWAAESAILDYGCDPSLIRLVPLGANVDGGRTADEISRLADERLVRSEMRLLLAGVNWERKGCDFAIRVLMELRGRGVRARLDIVGCEAPRGTALPEGVQAHGYVSKSTASGRAAIDELYRKATAFILPTVAECFGVVFNEAASHGLPTFATATGGVPFIVRNGDTGFLFAPDRQPDEWAARIAALVRDPDEYRRMSLAALREYDERLNWASAGRAVARIVEEVVNGDSASPRREQRGEVEAVHRAVAVDVGGASR